MLEEKVKQVFADMVVLKEPERSDFFKKLSLPAYMRDWLVMKFSDRDGKIDYGATKGYIDRFIPNRDDFQGIKYNLMNGKSEKMLVRIRLDVNLKKKAVFFELPDFGGSKGGASGIVCKSVLEEYAETLFAESENWGIIELTLGRTLQNEQDNFGVMGSDDYYKDMLPEEEEEPEKYQENEIYLSHFKPFCPYRVDLDFFKEARSEFSIEEWIDVLIAAVDYNPKGYVDTEDFTAEEVKLTFLYRLLPFIENRINLIELAPKGTGKSYIFQKLSKRGWLVSGGTVSRASLIYDNMKKTGGLLTRFDYVSFDEVQSITFEQPGQIQQALKHYMEEGEIKGNDSITVSQAGVVVLGNIDGSKFDINTNMVDKISDVFGESATMDRFHGFIKGWKIPRLNNDLVANGWALNTEYFAEVLHALRNDLSYTSLVDQCLDVPDKADTRDMTAIKRLCTALVKLLYPHAKSKDDIPADEFVKYCLEPAKEMRGIIKRQLCIIDPTEFNVPGKRDIPDVQYNDSYF